jgi:ketosteroid isomerase-like protein
VSANADVVRRFIDAFNERDLEAFVETLDPDVEIHSMKGLRRGMDEARLWATREPGGVQQTVEVEELRESGDEVLALILRHWNWDEDSSPAGQDPMAWLFTVRDGKVVRWEPFEDRAEGLLRFGIEAPGAS